MPGGKEANIRPKPSSQACGAACASAQSCDTCAAAGCAWCNSETLARAFTVSGITANTGAGNGRYSACSSCAPGSSGVFNGKPVYELASNKQYHVYYNTHNQVRARARNPSPR